MTEHDDPTKQDPERRPREELDDNQSMGQPGEQGFSLTGMSEDAAAVIPPDASGGDRTDDGVPVGSSDVDADAERSGA
jgi:hypothetical protein